MPRMNTYTLSEVESMVAIASAAVRRKVFADVLAILQGHEELSMRITVYANDIEKRLAPPGNDAKL